MSAQTFAVPLGNTRNVTIVAHVDHGKTSFADSLLSSNNIISQRLAGKIRFLDSREDEQERGITMESSAVSLRFEMKRRAKEGEAEVSPKHILNLIDTPGHVDFASEVSTAARLCDGALVLVDVVEGVCTQTIAVLRQAWLDRLRPLLIINKMDRLITELKLSPGEAYHHLSQLIEQVNAVMGGFYASERMEDDLRWREQREKRLEQRREDEEDGMATGTHTPAEDDYEEKEDEDIYFAPDRGNVIFASAIDGWAFRVGRFAQLYADKLGIKEANLRRVLWGDWYLDPKSKRVVGRKKLAGRNLKPMFVQFVLENIWRVYETVLEEHNPDKVSKIVSALNVRLLPRDIRSKDTRNLLTQIMQQWLPLSTTTFQAVVDVIPSPAQAQPLRLPLMLHPDLVSSLGGTSALTATTELIKPETKLEEDLYNCKQDNGASVVVYVSKMFAVRRAELPEFKRKEITAEEMRQRGREARERLANTEEEQGVSLSMAELAINEPLLEEVKPEPAPESSEALIGFARIYSGTLYRNTPILAALPKYDSTLPPSHPKNVRHVVKVQVQDLYMMMGRELVAVEMVPAGNVFAIGGLEGKVPRNATLWAPDADGATDTNEPLVNLAGIAMTSAPIVRVALEPENPSDMPKLVEGLRLLNQADPCVEVLVQETGEHVILTAGELHLERCLKDLRERFANCKIQASEAIVPFRETAVKGQDMAPPKTKDAPRGTIIGTLANQLLSFKIRALPLPETVTAFLLANASTVAKLQADRKTEDEADVEQESTEVLDERLQVKPAEFWDALAKVLDQAGGQWQGAADRIWAFGPKRVGANLLLDPAGSKHARLRSRQERIGQAKLQGKTADEVTAIANDTSELESAGMARAEVRMLREFDESIDSGFQIATFQGPLCAEPVVGMAWIVEEISINGEDQGPKMAAVGSLISSVKDACRSGMLDWSPRIKLAMYTCDIQASTDVLGKVYAVVARRRGRIVAEEMKEGTSFFSIKSMLPVVESFGFADEIRKRTSGAASPQLIFSGFETLPMDPFWVPTTIEELEDLGEKADRANVAKIYVDAVRKRKGLFVEQKIVQAAEKQRTLKR